MNKILKLKKAKDTKKEMGVQMRNLILISAIVTMITFLFRWRYRILNMLFAIGFLRKLMVSFMMKNPELKWDRFIHLFAQRNDSSQ